MNSYPPELLTQLAPVMFVAGLDSIPTENLSTKAQDFNTLTLRLREALQAQRKVAVWQPEKSKTFQIVLVDREVKFPPRKLVSPEDSQYTPSHSPLSPLTPTSPLYPDGLIAPIWIRKHTTLVPSVFVLFMRIFEFPLNNSRTAGDVPSERERDREQEERRRDTDLAAEVSMRKKSTNERGIKLTVVLMASRKMLGTTTLKSHKCYLNTNI
jgi:trafficking protein particle complex subunit 11